MLAEDIILDILSVFVSAGRCIITDALSPVPVLVGQLVRYPKNATGQLVFCGEGHSVEEVYGRPSIYKKNAERDIIAEMDAAGGYGYTVLNHNGFYFSCGYYVEDRVGVLYFVNVISFFSLLNLYIP